MDGTRARVVAKTAAALHKQFRVAAVDRYGQNAVLVAEDSAAAIVALGEPEGVEGTELSPKFLRKFLWERRGERAVQRDRMVLWTSYDAETDTSFVGVGCLVDPDVARKLETRGYEVLIGADIHVVGR
jgi:hypothetical protein